LKWIFAILAALLALEWFLRRYFGAYWGKELSGRVYETFFSFVNVTFYHFKSVLNVFFNKMSSSMNWNLQNGKKIYSFWLGCQEVGQTKFTMLYIKKELELTKT
jgi:hypothetical protein